MKTRGLSSGSVVATFLATLLTALVAFGFAGCSGSVVEGGRVVTRTNVITVTNEGSAVGREKTVFRTVYVVVTNGGVAFASNQFDLAVLLRAQGIKEPPPDVLAPKSVGGGTRPDAAAEGPEPGRLLWFSQFEPGRISRVHSSDGGAPASLLQAAGAQADLVHPMGLAVDGGRKALYWCDFSTGELWAASWYGGGRRKLLSLEPDSPQILMLHRRTGVLYWTVLGEKAVRSLAVDSGVTGQIALPEAPEAQGIALDDASDQFYYVGNRGKTIRRLPLAGGEAATVIADGLDKVTALRVDGKAGRLFWIDAGSGRIRSASVNGEDPKDLVTSGLTVPYGLALDGTLKEVYWTDAGTKSIMKVDYGGVSVRLVTKLANAEPKAIATD